MKLKALGYIFIEATKLPEWKNFMTNVVGLMEAPALTQTDDTQFYKMDEYSWRIAITKGETDRLAVAGWELASKEAFHSALKELAQKGVEFSHLTEAECSERLVREAVRLNDPSGNTIELFYYMKIDYKRLVSPVGVKSFLTGYNGDLGLGHFVIPTAEFEQSHEFYREVLGFENTDYMHFNFNPDPADKGQGLHFMHCDNPRHHSLALFQDPNPPAHRCVHLMVEVEDIDELGLFIERCKQHEVKIVASMGRHTNDLMISAYVMTPGGFALEFGCDGVQLDWDNYTPTESSEPSLWGHIWDFS